MTLWDQLVEAFRRGDEAQAQLVKLNDLLASTPDELWPFSRRVRAVSPDPQPWAPWADALTLSETARRDASGSSTT